MDANQDLDQAAYRRLAPFIKQTYPPGRFVAIVGGQIVADDATFAALHARLTAMGVVPPDGLVVEVGDDYPETAIIFGLAFNPQARSASEQMPLAGPSGL